MLKDYHLEQTVYDIIKTGRKIWISIYFKSPGENDIPIDDKRKQVDELESETKRIS